MTSGLEGTTLGQYRLMERLGKGGMAEVYKAYQPSLDRYVAIKILHAYFAEEEDFRSRFQREARAVARLRHPNIVQVYDFGVEDNIYFMAMEFLAGGTLKQRLRSAGEPLPPQEVLRIVERVAAALDYAHDRGLYHRDVKPANIMLTEDNEVILTDFGLAKMAEGSQYTRSGVSVGTPEYMAPEQGQGLPIDHRADIYSLGVVLYELLIGQLPFTADTPVAIIFKHIKDPLPLPRALNPSLSEDIERVMIKALAKSPDDRYQRAGELAASLRQALAVAGGDLPTPPPAPAPDSRVLSPETPAPPSPPPARADVTDAEVAAAGAAAAASVGGRIEQGVKRAVSRAAGATLSDDWPTIGDKMEERARRTAARWAGVDAAESWEVIGEKLGERFEAKIDGAVEGGKKGEKEKQEKREEKQEEKDEKDERRAAPGWGGRRSFLIGCLILLLLCLCCSCGLLLLGNCDRPGKPLPTPASHASPTAPAPPPPADRWEDRRYEPWSLSLRVPADWRESPLNVPLSEGVQFTSPPVAGLSGVYSLYVRPPAPTSPAQLLEILQRRELSDRIRFSEFQDAAIPIGGAQAVGGQFVGDHLPENQRVRGELWVFEHGEKLHVILAFAPEPIWERIRPLVREITASIKFIK